MIPLCCMCFFIELLILIHMKRVRNGERKLLGPVHTNAFSFENASTEDKALSFILSWTNTLACENSCFSALFAAETAVFAGKYISVRLSLSSTLIRRAFSSKTHRFENALGSGSKRKRTNRINLDGRKRNKTKWKVWLQISQARVFVACA